MARRGGIETTVHPCQIAYREDELGNLEEGKLFFIEQVRAVGKLRATYEYSLFHWPESQCWTGDVVSPHGWHDIDEDEVLRIARDCGIREALFNPQPLH